MQPAPDPARAGCRRDRFHQRGLTLVEVLVTIVILAIGLLGIAGAQAAAIHTNHLSYQYTQAALLVQGMVERMRGNPEGVRAGLYALEARDMPPEPDRDCSSESCDPAELAAWDVASWHALAVTGGLHATGTRESAALLPGAAVSIQCTEAPCTDRSLWLVTAYWDADRSGAQGTDCDATDAADLRCFRLAYAP